jgi:ATP-dependent exoDNAse (exonuclease V) alpha subunit
LNRDQCKVADDIFLSCEKIVGLDGVAGAGKTTTLAVVREGAQAQGYKVEGFAPTSRAAHKLAEAGMENSTLQHHLARGVQPDTGEKRLYVLDESSLASTRQMHEFIERLHRNDRVLLVGDSRQHDAVEAGRPFAQLQEAGMCTATLSSLFKSNYVFQSWFVVSPSDQNASHIIETADARQKTVVRQIILNITPNNPQDYRTAGRECARRGTSPSAH